MSTDLLLTPGPTQIPLPILQAMALPATHHRTEAFQETLRRTRSLLQNFLDSPLEPVILTCSGTGGLEALLQSACSEDAGPVVVVNAGKFGERWAKIANSLGLNVREFTVPFGSTVDLDELKKCIKEGSKPQAFCLQLCETSTGIIHPVEKVSDLLQEITPETLFFVDAISAAATLPISCKKLHTDGLVIGSQKAFALPPGLTAIALSSRALAKCQEDTSKSTYFDLGLEYECQSKGNSAWTPATSLIAGMKKSLEMLFEEGLEKVFLRHQVMSEATQAAVAALKLPLFNEASPAPGVTAFSLPKGISAQDIRHELFARFQVRIAGGQGKELKGKILRVGHMGFLSWPEFLGGIGCLDIVVSEYTDKESGLGITAATRVVKKHYEPLSTP